MAEEVGSRNDEPLEPQTEDMALEAETVQKSNQSESEYQEFIDYIKTSKVMPKPASKAFCRFPWIRLRWSTWIVAGVALAILTLIMIPGNINNHDIFTSGPVFFEHGWPFIYLDRYAFPIRDETELKEISDIIEKDRNKEWLPWRSYYEQVGSLKGGFFQGEPFWIDKSNWSFSGQWFICKTGLVLDVLMVLDLLVVITVAYEYWCRRRWHYSLRSLLACIALVAIVMAWWRAEANSAERELRAV